MAEDDGSTGICETSAPRIVERGIRTHKRPFVAALSKALAGRECRLWFLPLTIALAKTDKGHETRRVIGRAGRAIL